MSNIVTVHNLTCPAGTPVAAPTETVLDPNIAGTLIRVRLVIPDGHYGLTGIAFGYGHNPVVPQNGGVFISGNNESMQFDLDGFPVGVPWSAFTCNLGFYSHAWQVRCEYNNIVTPNTTTSATPISASDIAAAAVAGATGP